MFSTAGWLLSHSCPHLFRQELASWFLIAVPRKCLGMPSDRAETERSPVHSTEWRVPSLSVGRWSCRVLPKEVTPLQSLLSEFQKDFHIGLFASALLGKTLPPAVTGLSSFHNCLDTTLGSRLASRHPEIKTKHLLCHYPVLAYASLKKGYCDITSGAQKPLLT